MYLSISRKGFWVIKDDYLNEQPSAYKNNFEGLCPHFDSTWSSYKLVGGEWNWKEDLDATVRCYDCQKYPSSPECETCSDNLNITSEDPSSLGLFAQYLGEYNINQNIPAFNNRKVYKQKGRDICLYFHCSSWQVYECSNLKNEPNCLRYFGSSRVGVPTCANFPGLTWNKEVQVVPMANQIKSGHIKSKNYPEKYPNDNDETWQLEVPEGSIIRLTFEDFELERRHLFAGSCYDFVIVIDSDGTTELGKFCEKITPAPITSTGNKLTVVFHSDGSRVYKGFKAKWIEQK